jgi:hypothetical protein
LKDHIQSLGATFLPQQGQDQSLPGFLSVLNKADLIFCTIPRQNDYPGYLLSKDLMAKHIKEGTVIVDLTNNPQTGLGNVELSNPKAVVTLPQRRFAKIRAFVDLPSQIPEECSGVYSKQIVNTLLTIVYENLSSREERKAFKEMIIASLAQPKEEWAIYYEWLQNEMNLDNNRPVTVKEGNLATILKSMKLVEGERKNHLLITETMKRIEERVNEKKKQLQLLKDEQEGRYGTGEVVELGEDVLKGITTTTTATATTVSKEVTPASTSTTATTRDTSSAVITAGPKSPLARYQARKQMKKPPPRTTTPIAAVAAAATGAVEIESVKDWEQKNKEDLESPPPPSVTAFPTKRSMKPSSGSRGKGRY